MLFVSIGQKAWSQEKTTLTELESGSLSSTVKWTLYSKNDDEYDLHLSITGTGAMPDFGTWGMPWESACPSGDRRDITSITIADGITKIGANAFNWASIDSIDIPSSVTSIGAEAFRNSALKEIYIPSSVISIGAYAFSGCSSLSLIHYDESCTSSTGIAFTGVASKGKFIEKGTSSYAHVPSGWERYSHGEKCSGGAWVAESGSKLFVYSKTPGAVVDFSAGIGDYSGTNPWRVDCDKYTSLEINKNIASFDEKEFIVTHNSDVAKMGYTNMKTITVESGNSNFIVGADGALYDKAKTKVYLYPAKSNATEIEIPASVTEIRPGAFYGAKSLQKVTFLGTVNKIGIYAFAQASSLNFMHFATKTAPTYPVSIVDHKSSAFKGVASVGVIAAETKTDADKNAFEALASAIEGNWTFDRDTYGPAKAYISNGTLYVKGKGEYDATDSKDEWYSYRNSITKIVVEEGVTDLDGAFEDLANLREVTLNNTGKLGRWVFNNITALTRVNIGPGLKEVDGYAHLINPENCVCSFTGCSNLSIVNIADLSSFLKITGICGLTDYTYGTVKGKTLMINGIAWNSSDELVVPEGVANYHDFGSALKFFKNVTKIKLPTTVTDFHEESFKEAIYLKEITLPSNLERIGESAFEGCTGLTSITLPASVNYIGPGAFRNCTGFKSVTLPARVESVGQDAFSGCTGLNRIICLAATPPSIERGGFSYPMFTIQVADEPSGITLKVPNESDNAYKSIETWKEFNIETGKMNRWVYTYINSNESIDYNKYISSTDNVADWRTSDASVATVNNGVVTAANYIYDGTTGWHNKDVNVYATTDNCDVHWFHIVVSPTETALTDGNAYKLTSDFEAKKISYTRSFSQAGKWQAIYLPFAFDVEKYRNDFDIAEIFTICPTSDTNGDGQLDANDDKKLIISVLKSGETQPNAPYMIRPKAATTYTIVSENTTLASAEINEVEFGTSRTQYSVKGIYDADFYAVPGDNNIYITASGGFGVAKNKNVNVKPNRWILHEEAKNYVGSSTSSSNVKDADITIEVLGEDIDETTAIRLINGETISAEGKSNTMYNFNGMKVDSSKSLPSGIYIINGKKVFKK